MTNRPGASPEQALASGRWVKLIAGASNEDLCAIEALTGIYALAGVHCVDLAADPAVVEAARRGLAWARRQAGRNAGGPWAAPPSPWLMVSLSDGEDPHFRKAWFDPALCPPACPRPCERVCPAEAIPPRARGLPGVTAERCYGCGRCLPLCPLGLIQERHHVLDSGALESVLRAVRPDAVEIHTQIGRAGAFERRLHTLRRSGLPLARLAVSCGPERGPPAPEVLAAELWQRFDALQRFGYVPLWQLDGRPMSGDVGGGSAHAAVGLLERIAPLAPPGPLQLAGGTNAQTLPLVQRRLAARSLRLSPGRLAGVAFGGAARRRLAPLLRRAEERGHQLLDDPELCSLALDRAGQLISPWLGRSSPTTESAEG